jgi:dipeptidyl-peptidase 4
MIRLIHLSVRRSIIILVLVTCAAVAQDRKPLTFSDVFSIRDGAGGRGPTFQWLKDGASYSITKKDSGATTVSIWKVDARTAKETLLIDLSKARLPGQDKAFRFQSYTWTNDDRCIVFTLSTKQIWRRSTTGEYAIYDVAAKKLYALPQHKTGIRNVKVSPDGTMAGYVFEDNLYVCDLASGAETQLTNDATTSVYNGRFGWVYEEEFSIVDGWQWSPDSKRIACYQESETSVPEYTLTDWSKLHLELEPIRYPKPGDPNPVEKIGIIDVKTRDRRWLDLGSDSDQYVPRMYWTNDANTLCVYRLNRLQNHLELLLADVSTGQTRLLLEERSPNGWIDVENGNILRFLKTKKQFVWASERDGWNHLYLYDMNGKLVNQITKGEWEVTQTLGLTPDEKFVYYVSTEVSPTERHLYRIRLDGGKKARLDETEGSHSFNMNPTCELYTDTWSSVSLPSISKLMDTEGKEYRTLSETKVSVYEKYLWSPKEVFTFKTSDGVELYASMIKPPNFDAGKKYPVIFDVYGGPGYQNVRNAWPSTMHEWYANEGFVVIQVDNRGGGARGTDFKFRVYKQLGKWEANDYVECVKYLTATHQFIDKNRIGIWGWSYGGFMAALSMLLGADYFAAAVAVAPVTDWKFYDTIYAERYMQRPQDNPEGYKVGSCVENADKLKGKLMLIHGGMDDNVHLQNHMQFVDRLQEAGKLYDSRIYPQGDHGVARGMNSYSVLLRSVVDYLKENMPVK